MSEVSFLRALDSVSESIHKRRADLSLSQESLAALAGLHRNTVRHLERSEIDPTVVTVGRILFALGARRIDLNGSSMRPCFGASSEQMFVLVPSTQMLREIGRAVNERRHSLGICQERLAELSGVHPNTVGHVERGEVDCATSTLFQIYHALDVREISTSGTHVRLT